ncbi:hypothetical protein T439DRAFT_39829 [Meredithblackwellia eburnea MCA 4105]
MSTTRRPTTPLRRLSASSLRSLSLSHSRSRPDQSTEHPLQHLAPVFAELADALSDLAGNIEQLDNFNSTLDSFNEAFAAYLYSLRVNAYTVDFEEAPTPTNIQQLKQRRKEEQDRERFLFNNNNNNASVGAGAPGDNIDDQDYGNNTTLITPDSEFSFITRKDDSRPTSATRGARGGSTRGGRGGGARGGAKTGMTKKRKDELMAFSDEVIQLLPITFREQQPQRGSTEKVLHLLRESPAGVNSAQLPPQLSLQPQC